MYLILMKETYTQNKIKPMGCLVYACFLKIIVCKDDEIPAFSAMMKMGLNYLHLTNWLCERNTFGLV